MPASSQATLAEARATADKQLRKRRTAISKAEATDEALRKIRFVRSEALKKLQCLTSGLPKEQRAPVNAIVLGLEQWERENVDKLSVTKKTLTRQAAAYQSLHTETKKLADKMVNHVAEAEKRISAPSCEATRVDSADLLYSGLMWSPFCSVSE